MASIGLPLIRLRDAEAKVTIIRRVARIEQGNFGDHKFCRDGVWELRVDVGRATGCTTVSPVGGWCSCYAVTTSKRNPRISTAQ